MRQGVKQPGPAARVAVARLAEEERAATREAARARKALHRAR
jgi:hypothetical protein